MSAGYRKPESARDRLREEQAEQWLRGNRVLVERLLAQQPDVARDNDAVLELISAEFLLREQAGEEVSLEEYERRFPELAAAIGRQLSMHRLLGDLSGDDSRLAAGLPSAAPLDVTTELSEGGAISQQGASSVQHAFPQIDAYDIARELGKGGMGVVYLARHLRLQRTVALKMIRDQALAGPKVRERFQAEAKAVARLQHPHIVQIYDYGDHRGLPYLSLEYVSGGSLDRRIAGRPQPVRASAVLVETLARAVAYAHRQGIIHRDLKPANILLAPPLHDSSQAASESPPADSEDWSAHEPKIADFGLAKCLGEDLNLTHSEALVGSSAYMAPEQAWGNAEQMGPGTDIHALGLILYELLTGKAPFREASLAGTLDRIRFDVAPPPSRQRADVPTELDSICLRCLEKRPANRYASADDLAEDLRRFLAGEPLAGANRIARNPSRRSAALTMMFVAALVGAGAVAWWLGVGRNLPSGLAPAAAAPIRTKGEQFAFLVGVRKYELGGQAIELEFTEADVDALSRSLLNHGYERKNIQLLTQWSEADNPALAPTGGNIRGKLRSLLESCIADDTVLMAVTGMGGDLGDGGMYSYLPADGRPDERESLISLAEFYDLFRACPARLKLLLVDTCQTVNRDVPPMPKLPEPPPGVAVIFACSPLESSYEDARLKHGVFSYHVLQALNGSADVDGNRQISLDELYRFTRDRVQEFVAGKFANTTQTPLLQTSLPGDTPIFALPATGQ